MSEKKKRICSALISLLCLVMLLASVMPCSYSADEKTSVTLVCVQDSIKVQGMEWKLYRVGERRSDSIALIGEFEKYTVDMSELSAETIRCIAQTLESFIIGDHIEADADHHGHEDQQGQQCCRIAVIHHGQPPSLPQAPYPGTRISTKVSLTQWQTAIPRYWT